jgi:hypothetical protein
MVDGHIIVHVLATECNLVTQRLTQTPAVAPRLTLCIAFSPGTGIPGFNLPLLRNLNRAKSKLPNVVELRKYFTVLP